MGLIRVTSGLRHDAQKLAGTNAEICSWVDPGAGRGDAAGRSSTALPGVTGRRPDRPFAPASSSRRPRRRHRGARQALDLPDGAATTTRSCRASPTSSGASGPGPGRPDASPARRARESGSASPRARSRPRRTSSLSLSPRTLASPADAGDGGRRRQNGLLRGGDDNWAVLSTRGVRSGSRRRTRGRDLGAEASRPTDRTRREGLARPPRLPRPRSSTEGDERRPLRALAIQQTLLFVVLTLIVACRPGPCSSLVRSPRERRGTWSFSRDLGRRPRVVHRTSGWPGCSLGARGSSSGSASASPSAPSSTEFRLVRFRGDREDLLLLLDAVRPEPLTFSRSSPSACSSSSRLHLPARRAARPGHGRSAPATSRPGRVRRGVDFRP